MSFKNQHHRYKRRIDKLWAPVSIEVMLQEGPEKKISILKKAQQQAAKEILHLEEASAFMELLESEIKKYQDELNNNDPSSTSQTAQSNETQTTGESVQIEKINWKGSQTQLAYLVQILLENGFIEHGDHWKMCAEQFLVKGKPINNKKLAVAMGNMQEFNKDGKPKKGEILESIVSDISSLNN